jgi:hypothetical protein
MSLSFNELDVEAATELPARDTMSTIVFGGGNAVFVWAPSTAIAATYASPFSSTYASAGSSIFIVQA